MREAVRAASDKPDEAFNWVQEVYEKTATNEALRITGKFLTLDTKILNSLSRVAKGELNRQIINYKESEAAAGRAARGRQVLFMFEQFFKANEAAGSLYSVEDLLKVKLTRDDLSTFIHNWESVIAGLNHQPEETTLRDILLRELRNSTKLKFDLEVYDRAKEGGEKHTYGYLVKCVKELLERERTRSNRTAIARAHGARYGAPAYDEKPKTPTTPRGREEKKPCFAFQRGRCPRGKNCPFEHVKADPSRGRTPPRSPKGGRPSSAGSGKGSGKDKDKSKIPCIFYPKGTCKNGKNCPFLHKDASPSVPAKGDKDGKQRANIAAKRRRPSKKRGKSVDKKAACCLSADATLTGEPFVADEGVKLALAARKGEAGPRDHWVVDEDKGTCVRVHQKFRTSLYVPQPDHCPVPFWRLKGNAEARMYPNENSKFFVEKEYNFKSGDLRKPVGRWIGTTTFRLKPKRMKAKFASRHETIDIALEGDGWSFVKPKRLFKFRYPKIEDCPKSDPNDLNDALESAIYLESAVTGMNQGIDVRCKYKCRTRDGFCIHCKCAAPIPMIATPARANASNLEIIADTGSEEDLISNSDLEVHFKERARQISSNAVSLITANGPVEADTKHEVHSTSRLLINRSMLCRKRNWWPTFNEKCELAGPGSIRHGRSSQIERAPFAEPILHAMCALAVLWGWNRWAAVTLTGFYAICRPGEPLACPWHHLVTSENLLEAGSEIFWQILEPKTRRRGARVQHAQGKGPLWIMKFISASLDKATSLFTMARQECTGGAGTLYSGPLWWTPATG